MFILQEIKVKPFCYRGWCLLNNHKFIPKNDEMEERVLNNINVMKTCVRIDIDRNRFKEIDFNHILINHTYDFNKNSKTKKSNPLQLEKIKWISDNIKPIKIFIVDNNVIEEVNYDRIR